jgi:hypothetical protein
VVLPAKFSANYHSYYPLYITMPCLKKFTTCVKLGGVYKIKGKKYVSKSQNIEKKQNKTD